MVNLALRPSDRGLARKAFPHMREVVLVVGAYFAYMFTRKLIFTDVSVAFDNAERVVNLEKTLGLYWEPVWQEWVMNTAVGLVLLFNWIYIFTFFPIVISLVTGLRSVDREMIDMFRTLGASQSQTFRKLMVPTALPNLFAGMKVAAVVSVIGAVIGEWVGASAELGWLMKISGPQFQTARVFAAIAVLSVLAMGLFAAVIAIEKWSLINYPPTANQVTRLGES